MSIWLWNPRTCRVSVPGDKVTIHGIESLEAAHNLMDNGFDPSKFQFVAQTKTGKPFNFETLEEAEAFAVQKSNKRSGCTVYHNGKPVVSYFDKKKMPKWQVVYHKKIEDPYRMTKKQFYYRTPKGEGDIGYWNLVNKMIETLPGKVRISDTHMRYVKCKNGHLTTQFMKDTITFHANGNVYCFENGKIVHKSAKDISKWYDDEFGTALINELVKLRPELNQALRKCKMWDIPAVFSRPTSMYCFDTFHKKAWERNDSVYFGYFPREIVDESKIIDVVAKRMRIPVTKSLRKVYNENMHNMTVVHFLKSIGFKDTNSYQKLIGLGVHFCRYNPDKFSPFMKKLIELKGENHVVKMLSDSCFDFILDAARSYPMIDEEIAEVIMKDSKNIEEIHETFNRHNSSSSHLMTEREIQYSDKEKERFNFICDDGVRFELAKSNKDLAVVGYNMGICVGGYGEEAVSKRTTIIKMMRGDEYVACIEYKSGNVNQIKAKFNNPLRREFKSDIDAWLAHGNIACDCYDYNRIGDAWVSSYNYAHVNPRDFVPVHHEPVLRVVKCKHIRCKHDNRWFMKNDFTDDRIEAEPDYIDDPFMNVVVENRRQNNNGLELRPVDLIPAAPEPAFEAIETDMLPF